MTLWPVVLLWSALCTFVFGAALLLWAVTR